MNGYVYFYYNNDSELIYVGKSINVGLRWNSHNEPWKAEVKTIGVRSYPDQSASDIFEHYYIAKLAPKYNIKLTGHGTTCIELNDASSEIRYSVQEFNSIYNPSYCTFSVKGNQREQHKTEMLKTVITDVIDERYLFSSTCDLSKTVFVCEDYEIRLTPYAYNKRNLIPYCTNRAICALMRFIKHPPEINSEELSLEILQLLTSVGIEVKWNTGSGGYNIVSSGEIYQDNDKYTIKCRLCQYNWLTITPNQFEVDLKNLIYNMK